jgi:hypothetical protein
VASGPSLIIIFKKGPNAYLDVLEADVGATV